MTLLVLCDHDRGVVSDSAYEALTFAKPISENENISLQAVLIGEGAEEAAKSIISFGVEVVNVATHECLTDYGPEIWSETLTQIANENSAKIIVSSGTDRGNEVLAHVAARLEMPFLANCRRIEIDGVSSSATRIQWGGSLLEDVTSNAEVQIFSVEHHSIDPEALSTSGGGSVVDFEPDLDPQLTRTLVVDRVVRTHGITLTTAPVVVGGGRGVGSAEGFASLEELAEEIGGVVGCSRAVTNNGWRPHSDQVGQTGTRIAPEIYIASGISGAIQHWVGAMAAKNILAINTDPEANMVTKAGYAVLGDLHEVIPAITAEIRNRREA